MAEVNNIKPLSKEDFPEEYHELIDRLAFSLNPFMRQVVNAFAGQIDFNNLAQSLVQFEVTVDSDGVPITPVQIKISPDKKILGTYVINITNITDSTFPTGSPFISYSTNRSILNVSHITGLSANKRYSISALLLV